ARAGGQPDRRFFFQAEDGIRDRNVTGVQTCALPISRRLKMRAVPGFAGRPAKPGPARIFSLRAVLVAFALIPLNSLWIVHTEIVRYAGHPTTTSLFFNVVFSLTLLIALNAVVRRLRPAWAFSQAELLIVYTLLSLGSAMVGH